ncbi:cell wall hydrolase [Bosea psychrotolerans]|uniref:Cell wall hydrolase n=1 Tax=Bosea psychrotolerans TaxID=1871628 RepID=A0A2S4M022_9HYPH|nr:cell wall hydrolase [Bosea psychrotolerans]POR48008.1 cell wall hydrolase [Bosea psychrotolerans]
MRLRRRTRRIGSLGVKWALATVAPWALSAGVLVSFTASAGQNYGPDALPYSSIQRAAPAFDSALEEGPSLLVAGSAFRLPGLALSSAIRQAHLSFDDPERLVAIDPRQPRDDMKHSVSGFPEVDRTAKGDPLPGLRPGLSALPAGELERVVFGDTQPRLISGGFSLDAQRAAEAVDGPQIGFEPSANEEGLTDPAMADASPSSQHRLITSPRQAELHLESIDGSTPSVSGRAASSSSTPPVHYNVATLATPVTPAPPAALTRPNLVAKAPPATSTMRKGDPGPQISYAGLIAPGEMARQQRCLAEAVYFEARSESNEGRAAVAQVVLNRVKSGLYPDNVCGVVYQNASRYLACQFTFACEGKSLRITEPAPWHDAVRIAREVYEGTTYLPEVGGSTHYHANYVRPYWAKKLKKMDTIGQHVFYQLRPGQT